MSISRLEYSSLYSKTKAQRMHLSSYVRSLDKTELPTSVLNLGSIVRGYDWSGFSPLNSGEWSFVKYWVIREDLPSLQDSFTYRELSNRFSTKQEGEQPMSAPACTLSVDPSIAYQKLDVVYGVDINSVQAKELLDLLGKLRARRENFSNIDPNSKFIKKRVKEIEIAEAKVLVALDKHA